MTAPAVAALGALPELPVAVVVPLQTALSASVMLAFGPSRARQALAWSLAALPFVTCWLAPREATFWRAFLALGSLVAALRLVDLTRDRRDWPALKRVWLGLVPYDARDARWERPHFAARDALRAAVMLGLTVGAVVWLTGWVASGNRGVADHALATLVSAAAVYAFMDLGDASIQVTHRAFGLVVPRVQLVPIASRSVGEFWGERWNMTVNRWLRRNCFMPLARRRRAGLGLAWAFTVSGLIHFWSVLVPLGLAHAGAMALYFLVEGAILALEGRLAVQRWPRWAQHTWAVVGVLGPAPLFMASVQGILR